MLPEKLISRIIGKSIQSIKEVSGGSINQSYHVKTSDNHQLFCKINSSSRFPGMFIKEKNGLALIGSSGAIRVPVCMFTEIVNGQQVLILEWIEQGQKTSSFWKKFGQQLAALHTVKGDAFGFQEDNFMGALSQYNSFLPEWNEFFICRRLEPQVKIACQNGYLTPQQIRKFEGFYQQIPFLFSPENPVLVHGDLWSGNFMCNAQNEPVLIDPAIYYGNRHVDLAMSTLFGGFDSIFYESYHYYNPLPVDHVQQWRICNLYPLLVHLNLFGKSYLSEVIGIIDAY